MADIERGDVECSLLLIKNVSFDASMDKDAKGGSEGILQEGPPLLHVPSTMSHWPNTSL